MEDKIGKIERGYNVDLIVLDEHLNVLERFF
jgi:N-acetylglucosamine-6-phosphate deacetylase